MEVRVERSYYMGIDVGVNLCDYVRCIPNSVILNHGLTRTIASVVEDVYFAVLCPSGYPPTFCTLECISSTMNCTYSKFT